MLLTGLSKNKLCCPKPSNRFWKMSNLLHFWPPPVFETFKPRHYSEHRAGGGGGPRHPRALLCPGEDVFPQHPLLWWRQERGPQGLPQYDSGLLRLSVNALASFTCLPPLNWFPICLHWKKDWIFITLKELSLALRIRSAFPEGIHYCSCISRDMSIWRDCLSAFDQEVLIFL